MRCPACGFLEDKVVDSRSAPDGSFIRRRRECLSCSHRSTTFERVEQAPLVVEKRDGTSSPFEREKIVAGVLSAAKHRPITVDDAQAIAEGIEDRLQCGDLAATSHRIGEVVLDRLRELDQVAYLRFASVYKDFDDPSDFEREADALAGGASPTPDTAGRTAGE